MQTGGQSCIRLMYYQVVVEPLALAESERPVVRHKPSIFTGDALEPRRRENGYINIYKYLGYLYRCVCGHRNVNVT